MYYIFKNNTHSTAAYTQHLGFRHDGVWSASYFDSEMYSEPDTGVTSSVLVNGVLSFAIGVVFYKKKNRFIKCYLYNIIYNEVHKMYKC